MNINPIITLADTVATVAHAAVGQVRKYTNEPYVNHCREVAQLLSTRRFPDHVIAAGLLHDVLEDTKVTEDLLRSRFPANVVDLVVEVTDVSKPEDGNREVRKAKDLERLKLISPDAASIKYADLISNTRSIVEHDPDFAVVYLKEKAAILKEVRHGNFELYGLARDQLTNSQIKIEQFKADKMAKKVASGVLFNMSGGSLYAWLDDDYLKGAGHIGVSFSPVPVTKTRDNMIFVIPQPGMVAVAINESWFKKGNHQ